MKAILKKYATQELYEKDYPHEIKTTDSIGDAVEEAKEIIRGYRKTKNFIGFKVFDIKGDLKYKLPSY